MANDNNGTVDFSIEDKLTTSNDKNRINLLKELDIQKDRVAKVDKMKKEQDSLLKDISLAKKNVLTRNIEPSNPGSPV